MDLFQAIERLGIGTFYFICLSLRFWEHFCIPVYLSEEELEAQGHGLIIHMFY